MLILAAELLGAILLPAALTIFWKRRSQASWTCVFAALATFAVSYFTYPYFSRYILQKIIPTPQLPLLTITHIEYAFAYGILKYCIWWVVMRFKITKLNTWQNATLFGLTYSTAAAALMLLRTTERLIQDAAYYFKTNPTTEPTPTLQILAALAEIPSDQLAEYIIRYGLRSHTFYLFLDAGVVNVILNVSTALAIFYSIRHKRVWAFGAAILCYAFTSVGTSSTAVLTFHMAVRNHVRLPQIVGNFVVFVVEIFTSDTNNGMLLFIVHTKILLFIAAALPSLALALYMRKALTPNSGEE